MSNTDRLGGLFHKRLWKMGGLLLGCLVTVTTQAAELTQTMAVRLEIVSSCSLQSSTVALDFGSHVTYGIADEVNASIDGTAVLQVSCNQDEAWSVYADNGQNASGMQRRIRNGDTGDLITYDLYDDATRSTSFSTSASAPLVQTGTGSSQNLTIYGRIPANVSFGAAGIYRDTVILTFSF